MKKLIALILLLLPINVFCKNKIEPKVEVIEISPQTLLFETNKLGGLGLLHFKQSFIIVQNGKMIAVDNANICSDLRNVSSEGLRKKLSELDGFIKIDKDDNGNFCLSSYYGAKNYGLGGASAGFYIGKFLTHFLGHGTMVIVAACTGPAFPVTLAALEATFTIPLEAASNVVGLAGGIVGGVATGPV